MDSTRYSRAKEALKKQNTRSGNLKDCKAHARSAEAESSRAWTSSGPSPLRDRDNETAELNATDGPVRLWGLPPEGVARGTRPETRNLPAEAAESA